MHVRQHGPILTGRMRTAALATASILLLAAGLAPSATQAAGPMKLTVKSAGPATFWTGSVRVDGPTTPSVPECAAAHCDKVEIKVNLPENVWSKPGGLQFAIRWNGLTDGSLGMFVYRSGMLVAKSAAVVGTAQSVVIPSALNGTYTVYVSYGVTFGLPEAAPVIDYEGLAEVEFSPTVNPVRELVPDLRALPQEQITYDNPGAIFDDEAEPGQSCFDSERAEQGAVQCLRFDQVLQNIGTGPLELRFSREAGVYTDEQASQRVYRSDGTYYDLPAGDVHFHDVHGHYHFKGFAQSELWLTDGHGNLVGEQPAAIGDKVSFCVADTDLIAWGVKGDAPMSYPAPDCLDPKETVGTTEHFSYGMSVGWGDRYNWYLPDQMIDTNGLPDGIYVLFTRVDPDNKLFESSEANNCGAVIVALTGLATSEPHAELLGAGPACQ